MHVVLKESMYVLLFFKPGVDAYRVASGQEQHEMAKMDPMQEMVSNQKWMKCGTELQQFLSLIFHLSATSSSSVPFQMGAKCSEQSIAGTSYKCMHC